MENKKSGQVLLITIMLMATVITVVMTLVFKSTTETQITKLEEESKRALAAAEAGVEKSLENKVGGSFVDLGFTASDMEGIDLSQSKVDRTTNPSPSFVSPLVQRDDQYTFYLSDYDRQTNAFSNPWSGDLYFYFHPSGWAQPAIELTFYYADGHVTRMLLDPYDLVDGAGDTATTVVSQSIEGVTFTRRVLITIPASPPAAQPIRLVIARSMYGPSKFAFQSQSGANLPLQGEMPSSQAVTNRGVEKKITLFQSHPQIPADFFVSSY